MGVFRLTMTPKMHLFLESEKCPKELFAQDHPSPKQPPLIYWMGFTIIKDRMRGRGGDHRSYLFPGKATVHSKAQLGSQELAKQ